MESIAKSIGIDLDKKISELEHDLSPEIKSPLSNSKKFMRVRKLNKDTQKEEESPDIDLEELE